MGRSGGFLRAIARAQRDAEAARARAEREQNRYIKAQLREDARQAREGVRLLKEQARYDKERKLEEGEQEAADLTAEAADRIDRLKSILSDTLTVDDRIDFDSLRMRESFPTFSPPAFLTSPEPAPAVEAFLEKVPPLTLFKKLVPGAKGRHERAIGSAQAEFEVALSEWKRREEGRLAKLESNRRDHAKRLQDFDTKKAQRNSEIDLFEAEYRAAVSIGVQE